MLGISDSFFTELLNGSLSKVAPKKRRNLLIASAVGIVIGAIDNMALQKLNVFGIDFVLPVQYSFLALMAVVVAYFFLVFIGYGLAEFFIWRKDCKDYLAKLVRESQEGLYEDWAECEELHQSSARAQWLRDWYGPIAFLKLAFEFVAPLAAGALAVYMLLF